MDESRARVRSVLSMAAVAIARHRNRFADFYPRLAGWGKPAMVAVMRKMIVTLNARVKTGTVWGAEMARAA